MSVVILGFCFAVTLAALFQEKTLMWSSVPPGASVVIFFLLMAFVGMMEGMQIALFAVVNLKEEELAKHAIAHRACQLAFKGHNLQAFLIGRQICVTVCMFVVARITSLNVTLGTGENIFGVSDGLQQFFNTGLLGAVITTIVGSLMWRIIASSFSVAFLSNPLVYLILHICLVLEKTGICSAAWLLAFVHKKIVHYQKDKTYIGTPEDRTANDASDLELDEENGLKVEQVPEQAPEQAREWDA
jgi:magnesium-transporting ATPase (P-type)